MAESRDTGEIKYFLSNAPASAAVVALLRVAFGRWHIEKWFERAKQETGFGAFEVRTYDGSGKLVLPRWGIPPSPRPR